MDDLPPSILVTSVGAKNGLVKAFHWAAEVMGYRVLGIDVDADSPAKVFCDQFFQVPGNEESHYWEVVEMLCRRESVGMVIPTREEELVSWKAWEMERSLTRPFVACSDIRCLRMTHDKWEAYQWLTEQGLPTPKTWLMEDFIAESERSAFPYFAKARRGSGSRQVSWIHSYEDLPEDAEGWIVQEAAVGQEYTLNLYVNQKGECMTVVPHQRLEVMHGEVCRAITVDAPELVNLGYRFAEKLKGAFGPINFQVFWAGSGTEPVITDINLRFGGGYALAHEAGATFADWLLREASGEAILPIGDSWVTGLTLVRYAETFFIPPAG